MQIDLLVSYKFSSFLYSLFMCIFSFAFNAYIRLTVPSIHKYSPIRLSLLAESVSHLVTNQPTVLFVIAYQPNQQDVLSANTLHKSLGPLYHIHYYD